MVLDEECKSCLYGSQMKKVERDCKAEEKLSAFREEVKKLCANPPSDYCAPLLMRDIDGIHRKIFGCGIDYSAEKLAFNSAALAIEEQVFSQALASSDPIAVALGYAAAANYIDFAKLADLDSSALSYVQEAARIAVPDGDTLSAFKKRLSSARTLLFVHDNCGEVVFDKILIRAIERLYPHIAVTSLVRGGEIINDATLWDAQYIGLDGCAEVVSSGAAIPGTYLKEVSTRTLELLASSDVIISKGLGNLETLFGGGYDIFYVFMCKCAHIARRFGLEQWQTAFVYEEQKNCDVFEI